MRHQLVIAAVAWLACGAAALAEPAAIAADPETALPPQGLPGSAASAELPAPLSDAELTTVRAGEEVTLSVLGNQQLTALTSNNTVSAGVLNSGPISFDPSSLANFAGIGNFVLNTGANNSLQGAINITIMASQVTP